MRKILILLIIFMVMPFSVSMAANQDSTKEFRKIYKLGYKGNYVITGEAKPNSFFYMVEDGHIQYIHEKKVNIKGDTNWHPFKIMINIPTTALPQNGSVILTLYQRNKSGIIRAFPIVLDQFYQ